MIFGKHSNGHDMKKTLLILGAAMLVAAGCTSHRFGDARIQNVRDLGGVKTDRLVLEAVPIGQAGTHTLAVRDLPFALYPTHLRVPLTPTEAEAKGTPPWQDARLRIEFRAPNGTNFFSRELSLAEAERGRSPGTYHQLDVPFRQPDRTPWRGSTTLPQHTDYDVVVTVLTPSRSKTQRAILMADTYVK
jgi:hypothetical protein